MLWKCSELSYVIPAKDVIEPRVQVYLVFVNILKQLFGPQHLCYANKLPHTQHITSDNCFHYIFTEI